MNYESTYNNYIKNIPKQVKSKYDGTYSDHKYHYTPVYNYKETPSYNKEYVDNDYIMNLYNTKEYVKNDYKTNLYNTKEYKEMKIPEHSDITLIVIKNQLNGEVEYEESKIDSKEPYVYENKTVRVRKKNFDSDEAFEISKKLNIDFNKTKYDIEQFRMGLDVELEHGTVNHHTNVTNDDPVLTGKIALAHLNEFPDYYTRLKKLEEDAKAYWTLQKYIL